MNNFYIKPILENILLTNKIKVNISQEILNKIQYACKEIYEVEWSGIPLYSVKGDITDPDNMEITIEDILPMHKGSKTYTEYDLDKNFTSFMMRKPERMDFKIGHIHSHNSMKTYFSTVDDDELKTNAGNHNFYFSIIVNNYMDITAKVAVKAGIEIPISKKNYKALNSKGEEYNIGNAINLTVKKEILYTYNCDIITPIKKIEVEEEFKSHIDRIIKKAAISTIPKTFNNLSNFSKVNSNTQHTVNGFKSFTKILEKDNKAVKILKAMPEDIHDMDGIRCTENDVKNFLNSLFSKYNNPNSTEIITIDEVLDVIEEQIDANLTNPILVSSDIMEIFMNVYTTFFAEDIDDYFFKEVLRKTISYLEEYEYSYSFINLIIHSMSYLLKNYENDNRTTV